MSETGVIDESYYRRPSDVPDRIACGGVVCRVENRDVLVALAREQSFPSFVLPKGGREPGESLEMAARREVLEETGLSDLLLIRKLAVLERLAYDRHVWQIIHLFLFVTEQIHGAPTDHTRHHGVWWHDLTHLPDMFWPDQRRLLEENAESLIREVRDFMEARQ